MSALAKEDGIDADMAEMIAYEIGTLTNQLKELEENIKVFTIIHTYIMFIVLTLNE